MQKHMEALKAVLVVWMVFKANRRGTHVLSQNAPLLTSMQLDIKR